MRVRTKSQFELVEREEIEALLEAAEDRDHLLARVHALWGIGQLARFDRTRSADILPFLSDTESEVRAQAAKLLGDVRHAPASPLLLPLLEDESSRVRFFATEALGRIGHSSAVEPILQMLEENDDRDVYLRHGGAIALARIGESEPLARLSVHPSRAVRIAAVVALRRMQDSGVAAFLDDIDEIVVAEAARAINDDNSIEDALPALALLLEDRPEIDSDVVVRRAISANLRLGTAEAAARLAAYAMREGAPEPLRVDALLALSVLPRPSVLDRVDGTPRGEVRRGAAVAFAALDPVFPRLLNDRSEALRVASTDAALRLGMRGVSPLLMARLSGDASAAVRRGALRALSGLRQEPLEPIVRMALADADPAVRMDALLLLPDAGLPEAATSELLLTMAENGTMQEQHAAVTSLGEMRTAATDEALGNLLRRLEAGTLPPEIQLELRQAVGDSASPPLRARAEAIFAQRESASATAAFEDILLGGNRNRGQQIAMQNESAACTRCHILGNQGGADVGRGEASPVR
jgi:HEAT repeat protein